MDCSEGYNEFLAELYDYIRPYRDRKDVDFFVDIARSSAGPVLELGCGTGRVLIPTARAGIEIVGLDASASMLSVCQKRLSAEPEAVRLKTYLVQGDMRQFEIKRQFALITIPFRPFQHLLTTEDQLSCLQTARHHLTPGGCLILDVFNPSLPHLTDDRYLEEHAEEPEFTTIDGRRVVRHARIVARDFLNQISDAELIYYVTNPNGSEERVVHRFRLRYLFRFELEHLLARCGFRLEALYADYDKSPYGSKYPGELIAVARKV